MGWSAPRVGRADNRAKHAALRDKCSVGSRLVLHVTKRARAARHGTRKRRLRRFEAAAADVARCRWRIASANMCLPPGQWIGVSWWFGQLIVSYAQFVRTDPRIDVNGLTAVKWALVWRCNCWTIVSQPRARLREEQITCSSCAIRTNHGTRQRVWSVCLRPSLHRATRSQLLRRALQTSRMQPFNGHAIVLSRGACRGAPAIRVGGRSL